MRALHQFHNDKVGFMPTSLVRSYAYLERTTWARPVLLLIIGIGLMNGLQADQQAGQPWLPLQLEGPQHWSFAGGAWQQQEQGIITHGTEPAEGPERL